jgi:PBSX family phage terminase large subunit
MELNPKQKAFADYYIECGNQTEAAKRAGYSEKTAYSQGNRLMKHADVSAYIAERMKTIESDRILSLKDIQEFRSRVVKGEEKDQFEIEAALADRLKAANDLEKALLIKEQEEEKRRLEESARNAGIYHMDLDIIADNFHPVIRDIRNGKHSEYDFPGGRGSTKSSAISCTVIELIKNNPTMHALVMRKVGNTIKDSVYAQIKWAIQKMGLEDEFRCKTSPIEITYKPTGQKIYFRGADDPLKIKSIKPEFGYIGIVWFEELDQFAGPEEIRNIEQSAIRGGDVAFKLKSFNPPKSKNNWANEYIEKAETENPEVVVHRSTFLDVPSEWLGQRFIDDAEHLKEVNPKAYDNEYMGNANGTGGNVFEYIEKRTITDEEIATFDRIYQGVDWGWYPDAYAFVRAYYDSTHEKIYLLDENYVHKTSNEITAEWIREKGYDDYVVTCDSNENKSVSDYRDMGIPAREAIKGPGSVEYGFKWLQRRTIVIDKSRTPNAYDEFTKYEYDRDKDGNIISGYPEGQEDHTIAAVRYAFESLFNRRGNSA